MRTSKVIVSKRGSFDSRAWLAVVCVVITIVAYLMYDLGLSRAGFLRTAADTEIDALESRARELTKVNKQLSERIAVLETAAKIDKEAYRQVDAQLADMQSKILHQQEDIQFYRGIVGKANGAALRVQSFLVRPGLRAREFELHLVLAQALRDNWEITGKAEVRVEGLQGSEPVSLNLTDLGGASDTLKYTFLYFEELKADVTLPAGFTPQRVQVVLQPKGKGAKTVEEVFDWQLASG